MNTYVKVLILMAGILFILNLIIFSSLFTANLKDNYSLPKNNSHIINENINDDNPKNISNDTVIIRNEISDTVREGSLNHISSSHNNNDDELDRSWINEEVNSKYLWMNIYGDFIIDNHPAEIGDKVGVFTSDGRLCGVYTVKQIGKYGFLHCYSDESIEGDKLSFLIYDKSKDIVLKPRSIGEKTWNVYENKKVDLDK